MPPSLNTSPSVNSKSGNASMSETVSTKQLVENEHTSQFPKYLLLPLELREIIMHEYLLLERDAGSLSKYRHQHVTIPYEPCCYWDYPSTLIACDSSPARCIAPGSGRTPWLPALGLTNKQQILPEVTAVMLRNTKRFDLRYRYWIEDFRIAGWFLKFLENVLPKREGLGLIHHLVFPEMWGFNQNLNNIALRNDSVELIAACSRLRKLEMTFTSAEAPMREHRIESWGAVAGWKIVSFYRLWQIFDCAALDEIYLDGHYESSAYGGHPNDLAALEELGKWFKKGFWVKYKRDVAVRLSRRCNDLNFEPSSYELIQLDEES